MKGYEAVARALRDNGVECLFGLIGDANLLHVASYLSLPGSRYVGAVIEGGAVSMADGYARVSGRVGAVTVTFGPGAANTINAMVEATRAHTPLLLLTGDTPGASRSHPQDVDLRALFAATGADFRRTLRPKDIGDDIAIAVAQAAANQRPVVLDIPRDFQYQTVAGYQRSPFAHPPLGAAGPGAESLATARELLADAQRPLVLGGRGAVLSDAGAVLIRLADALGAPVATTASGKDLFYGHPFDLGFIGGLAPEWVKDIVKQADCVIAFGAALNGYTTANGELLNRAKVIQVDVDSESFCRTTPIDLGMRCDAAITAEMLVQGLEKSAHRASSFRTDVLGAGVTSRPPSSDYADTSTSTTLDMRTAMIVLEELLPADKTVVTDAGRSKVAPWRYLHVREPRNFVQTAQWASIGLGVSCTVGAALARPDLLAVGVCGDGGAMMGLIEFTTAVRNDVPLVLVILNDEAYGAEITKFEAAGFPGTDANTAWPDFAKMAVAMGGDGVTVRNTEELRSLATLLRNVRRPLLIDVKCDPEADPTEGVGRVGYRATGRTRRTPVPGAGHGGGSPTPRGDEHRLQAEPPRRHPR